MALPGFHGRTEELTWLRGLWDACTARDPSTGRFVGGPRAAFIIAESGIGKSRLVQALYQQLTTDPAWDPPEIDYWPDAFNDQGVQLRVVPDMSDHVAQGPPRFAWLGARWQPTDVRNVSDRRSVLPELRHSIMVHAEILRRQGSLWKDATGRIHEAIRRDGIGEVIEQVADSAVPFGGLLMKLAKGAMELAKDRRQGPLSNKQADEAKVETLIDEVCECLHSLVDGAGGLPTILWLDDAQWIDAETQLFLRRIWRTAEQRRWPLLLVVTHWEREWRELKQSSAQAPRVAIGAPPDLCWLDGEPGVEVRILEPAPSNALAEYLRARLTGLTPAQRELMLDKAGGNFLTLVENVGQLLRVPQNFVDRDVAKPLSAAGERKVSDWESDRQKRVEQRFTELAPELQDMLGWGSHLGVSFLREVVEEYAERVAGMRGAPDRLREAVDPLVILGEPSEHLREFRDRAFHHVARRHFVEYGQEHADALDKVLQERLIEWVNNSFDEEGNELWPNSEEGISAPPRSVTGLTNEEARDVLSMAARCLPIPEQPDWDNPADTAALRARCLLVVVDKRENLWDRVKLYLDELDRSRVVDADERVIANTLVAQLARTAWTAGARVLALSLANARLARARSTAAAFGIAESQRNLRDNLELVASLEQDAGNLDGALASYKEALQISSKLAEDIVTPEHQRDLSWSLDFVAHVEMARGNIDSARRNFERSFEIRLTLKSSLGTPQAQRDLSVSLNNEARVLAATGKSGEALERGLASLEIRRALADSLRTPESRGDVGWNLRLIAGIERARGNWKSALQHYQEALAIRRSVANSVCTPQNDRDLSISLQDVAEVEYKHGDRDASIVMYRESLALCRSVHHALHTAETLHELNTLGIRLLDVIESVATSAWIHSTFASALAQLELVLDLTVELERLGNAQLLWRLVSYWSFRADMLQARRRTVDAKLARAHAALIRDRVASLPKHS